MRFNEILYALLPWCAGAAILMAVVYGVGTLLTRDAARRRRLAVFAALCGYVFVVLGLTNFSREAGDTFLQVNLVPFSAWSDGFGEGSLAAFQLIVFNVLMFVPLGVLLPLLSQRMRGIGRVILCAFLFSLTIEAMQLHYATGIFELDDLFHNTMGAALGYALYALVTEKDVPRRRRMARVAGALGLYVAVFSLMGVVSARFDAKEQQHITAQDTVIVMPASAGVTIKDGTTATEF